MYEDRTGITNPTVQSWAQKLSNLQSVEIDALLKAPALPIPDDVDGYLKKQQWASAARAICFRAPDDNPDVWRNALPPDRVPIILNFLSGKKNDTGYAFASSPAADYTHKNKIQYIGKDEAGHHQFISTVVRAHKTDRKDVTVGKELLVLLPEQNALVSMHLGNDGKTAGLPAAFREVRVLKGLGDAYAEVISDLKKGGVGQDGHKLTTHLQNYQGYLSALCL